ncbi:MAG: 2-C-methyl-D-erythritol 2,4-cyclodiphosphate synthase [Planctomycetaceae bacterium]|nr:2-C-methyl-D-erythritol 2,4-cyclodiphosphate synthase [Planctomycetaceae bacterium]
MFRVGLGHDRHRLAAGRTLIIGGVAVPHEKGAVAHSDGDVLLHAITDALLGAVGLGDIGEWFPDTDPAFAGADSSVLISKVVAELAGQGWNVVNLDCTVFAQRPKLSPYKRQMAARIAQLLGVSEDAVSVKAKTGEKVGSVGLEEAIDAHAVVLLTRAD